MVKHVEMVKRGKHVNLTFFHLFLFFSFFQLFPSILYYKSSTGIPNPALIAANCPQFGQSELVEPPQPSNIKALFNCVLLENPHPQGNWYLYFIIELLTFSSSKPSKFWFKVSRKLRFLIICFRLPST